MASHDSSEVGNPTGDKSNKYDRQLRLWGDHGQSALEAAKVCLINATATGTEILKNVILPGIGSFTIVDGNKVTGEDVGNNFFLDKENIGKSRAQISTELLLELNEDVNGDFVEETPENLLMHNPQFFNGFSIVVVTCLAERTLLKLASQLYANDVPLLVCQSYGLVGYIRLVIREHTVIESHPDSAHEDLRLDRPFPGLVKYCDSLDMTKMIRKDHSHTPWLVVIYKCLQQWKQQHDGQSPKNYREKCSLKEFIRNSVRRNEDGMPEEEENFEEAIKHVNTSLVPTTIPDSVQKLFNDEACEHLHSESKPFWILVRALREFIRKEGRGCLPLRGSIPDMTSDSERYILLQNAYKAQANADIAAFSGYVLNILQSLGRPQDNISDADIRTFCRNASFLHVLRCRSLAQENDPTTSKCAELAVHLDDSDDDDLVYYVMLRAVDRFHAEFNRYPGYEMDSVESDIPNLKSCLLRFLQEHGISQTIKDDFVHEICRYGASEIHSVAAFIGGAAAQEVIKVVTSQFIPINNTYIYNAMKQTSTTLEL